MTGLKNHTNQQSLPPIKLVNKSQSPAKLPHSLDNMQSLLYELRTHQLELEMQNEELRRSQHALEISRTRYLSLYDLAPIGYLTLNELGLIIEANVKCAFQLGIPCNTLRNQPLSRYVFSEDQDSFYLLYKRLIKDPGIQCLDLRLQQSSGSLLWVNMQATCLTNNEYLIVLEDISDRKKTLEELERRVKERTAALEQANEQMQKVSFELVWAEERERERIAAELHDQVGQALLLAKIKLEIIADEAEHNSLRTEIDEAYTLIEKAIQDIRSLTFRMRPPILDTSGIETALEWLCSSVSSDYNIHIGFSTDFQPKPLASEIRYSVYQAVRELLLNVVKHASTDKAELVIRKEGQKAILSITDHGIGFDHPDAHLKHLHNGGYGLYNVKQRIEQMGGSFLIESRPGSGTCVTLMIPLDAGSQLRGPDENNNPAC